MEYSHSFKRVDICMSILATSCSRLSRFERAVPTSLCATCGISTANMPSRMAVSEVSPNCTKLTPSMTLMQMWSRYPHVSSTGRPVCSKLSASKRGAVARRQARSRAQMAALADLYHELKEMLVATDRFGEISDGRANSYLCGSMMRMYSWKIKVPSDSSSRSIQRSKNLIGSDCRVSTAWSAWRF